MQASAISEAKLKMSDVHSAVYLCSLIHQRYASFAPFLLENFQKCLLNKKDDGKVSSVLGLPHQIDGKEVRSTQQGRWWKDKYSLIVVCGELLLL